MYHTPKINQAPIQKNLTLTRFSSKDLQLAHYVEGLSPKFRKVASVYISHMHLPWVQLTNGRVASLAGCSHKTVTRATNQFHKDGFITKQQENKYAPNNYTFSDKVKRNTFSHWFNSLSPQNQHLYISHGIRIDHKNRIIFSHENVPQIKSSLLLDSLSSKNVIVSSRPGVKERIHIQDKSNHKKGRIMNSVQKQLILDNRHDPCVKEMLNNPMLMAHIITPTIQKITKLLTLDEKEQFKLTAFTDETLEYVYEEIEAAIARKKVPHIPNRMEWLIWFATQHCTNNNIKPDWKWYYDLCEIIGIDPKTEQKKFIVTKPKPKHGIYAAWTAPKEDPVDLRREKLKNDIESLSRHIELNTKKPYLIAHAISLVERKIKELQFLEAPHDFASTSH